MDTYMASADGMVNPHAAHELSPLHAWALAYAAAGYAVFPCVSGTKHPATLHGHLDATTAPVKWVRISCVALKGRTRAISAGLPLHEFCAGSQTRTWEWQLQRGEGVVSANAWI
jgi:hypothetical protein